jgi:hypothetical protein
MSATAIRPGEELVMFLLLPGLQQPDSGEDEEVPWRTVAEVEKELDDCDPEGIRYALDGLVAAGVADRDGDRVRPSRCALHINAMGVICV